MIIKFKKSNFKIELILLIISIYFNIAIYFSLNKNAQNNNSINEHDRHLRAELSLKLNKAMKKIGILNCNLTNNDVSSSGGWCARISGKDSIEHKTDVKFAQRLSQFLAGYRVASFGDGPGNYKEIFDKLNQVISYDAFDGSPFCETITNGLVKFLDLSVPIYHLPKYDWIVSVEVAEHIPNEFEQIFIDNLVRHAKLGVVLSWSTPGQIGMSHVNEKTFDYVKQQMELRHFMHDNQSSNLLKNSAELFWIKNNINIYRKKIK